MVIGTHPDESLRSGTPYTVWLGVWECLHTHQYQHYDTEFEGKGSIAKAKSEKCKDLRYQHFRKYIGSRGGPRVCLGGKKMPMTPNVP